MIGRRLARLEPITSPVAAILGWEPNGPCNGVVLAGNVDLTGAGVERLEYSDHWSLRPAGPPCHKSEITRHYDDQATHSTENCGAVAQTDLTFTVLKVNPAFCWRLAARRRVTGPQLKAGFRRLRRTPARSASAARWACNPEPSRWSPDR